MSYVGTQIKKPFINYVACKVFVDKPCKERDTFLGPLSPLVALTINKIYSMIHNLLFLSYRDIIINTKFTFAIND